MQADSDDAELLARWKAGSAEAGGTLIERNFPRIKRFFASKTSDHELLKELVQRTYTRCIEKVPNFEGRSTFSSFIYGIANNILMEHYREKRRAKKGIPIEDVPVVDLDPTPFAVAEQKSERKLIIHALRRLPLQMQIIAELYFNESLGGREISQILGIAEGTVRSRIRLCRKRLQEQIRHLAESPEQLESTLTTLSLWGRQVREQI